MNKQRQPSQLGQILSEDSPPLYQLMRRDLFTALEAGGLIEAYRKEQGGSLIDTTLDHVCLDMGHYCNQAQHRYHIGEDHAQVRELMLLAAAAAMCWVAAHDGAREP